MNKYSLKFLIYLIILNISNCCEQKKYFIYYYLLHNENKGQYY